MALDEKLQRIQGLLREYQNNFKEVPVLHSMVTQLLREVEDVAPTKEERRQDYDSIIAILPYSLWPRMID
jgi:translation initiation factor 2 beta subunit (eIF-2beta)/eIF-5